MGCNLYVESTRKVEYKGGYFNWKQDQLETIFRKYCPSFYVDGWSDHWEINREEFIDMIDTIKTECNEKEINGIDKDYFIECCEYLIKYSNDSSQFTDPEFMYFDWF